MTLTQLKTTLATLGLILVFIFGNLAVSPAHADMSADSVHTLKLHEGDSNQLSHAENYGLQAGLDCETCEVPTPSTRIPEPGRLLATPPVTLVDSLAFSRMYVAKIPLHMLASVLLI